LHDYDNLTPADSSDLAEAIAFSLRFEGQRRVNQADEYMAAIAASIVRHLERAGFLILKKPPIDRVARRVPPRAAFGPPFLFWLNATAASREQHRQNEAGRRDSLDGRSTQAST
jgi:hypothetical protein